MAAEDQKFLFTMIGGGAVRANPKRGGPAQVLQLGGERLLFDCGRCAVHNLARFGFRLEKISRIFITHLHFDHVCDLAHLLLLSWVCGRRHKMRLYGPSGLAAFLEKGLREAYAQDIQSRLAHGKDPAGLAWEVLEIKKEGLFLEENGCRLSALFTGHGGIPNVHYRLDTGSRRVVISSDTAPAERLAPFCESADLLVLECSGHAEFLARREWGSWHMNPKSAADLARKARVKRLVIRHLVEEDWTDDPAIAEKMAAKIRADFPGEVLVLNDGERLELS